MISILKVITGSKAHGLSTPESDTDTRVVYMLPTSTIISVGNYQKHIENKETDENSWELAHFIYLALRNNPTILEVFKCKPEFEDERGRELRELFPCFLEKQRVYDAYKGFAVGQRKKLLSPTTNYFRKPKSAVHYLRTLLAGIELLGTGDLTVEVDPRWKPFLMKIKTGEINVWEDAEAFEEVLCRGDALMKDLDTRFKYSKLPDKADKAAINDFLIKVRKEYWEREVV